MSDSPQRRPPGKTYGRQKRNLILFGQWIEVLNDLCQTNQAGIALRIGISKSTFSKITRGQGKMKLATVLKLIRTYEAMIAEQQIVLPKHWQERFFLAWSNDESLTEEAQIMLEEVERRNGA